MIEERVEEINREGLSTWKVTRVLTRFKANDIVHCYKIDAPRKKRVKGQNKGRSKADFAAYAKRIMELHREGWRTVDIASELNVTIPSVSYYLGKMKKERDEISLKRLTDRWDKIDALRKEGMHYTEIAKVIGIGASAICHFYKKGRPSSAAIKGPRHK